MKKPTLPIVAASASLTFVSCVNPSAQTGVNDFLKRNENSPVSVGRFGVTRKDGAPATTAVVPAEKPAPAAPAPVTSAPAAPAPQATVKTAPAAEAPKEEKPKFSFWKKKETTSPAAAPAAPAQAPAPAEPEAPTEAGAKKEKPKTTVKFSFWNKKEAAAAPVENAAQQAPAVPAAAPAAPAPQPQEEKPQGASRFSFWKKNPNSGEQKSAATKGSIGRFGYRAGQAAPPAAVTVQEAPPAPVKSTVKKADKPKLEPAPFVEPLPEKPQSAGQKSGGPRLPNMLNLPEEKDLKTKGSAPKSGGDGVISKPPVEKKD